MYVMLACVRACNYKCMHARICVCMQLIQVMYLGNACMHRCNVCTHVVYMCVLVRVCLYCMHASMYVSTHVHVFIYAYIYAFIYGSMYECTKLTYAT